MLTSIASAVFQSRLDTELRRHDDVPNVDKLCAFRALHSSVCGADESPCQKHHRQNPSATKDALSWPRDSLPGPSNVERAVAYTADLGATLIVAAYRVTWVAGVSASSFISLVFCFVLSSSPHIFKFRLPFPFATFGGIVNAIRRFRGKRRRGMGAESLRWMVGGVRREKMMIVTSSRRRAGTD